MVLGSCSCSVFSSGISLSDSSQVISLQTNRSSLDLCMKIWRVPAEFLSLTEGKLDERKLCKNTEVYSQNTVVKINTG